MNEQKLIEKLQLIEALYAGASTPGERVAAERARDRILDRLLQTQTADPPVEHRFTLGDIWSRKVFTALLRRYGLEPYRYSGQRYTTVMVRVPRKFVEETLWPQFEELSATLQSYLSEVTDRVVSRVLHQDSSEAAVVEHQENRGNRGNLPDRPRKPAAPAPSPAGNVPSRPGGSEAPGGASGGGKKRSGKRRRKRRR